MTLALGPFHFLSFDGGLEDVAHGKVRADALKDLDERLPQPNSLRRAVEDTKCAVLAAAELLQSEHLAVTERMGLYVGQQHVSFEYCSRFLQASYTEGPRLASPMYFAESVANNVATHLSLTLGFRSLAQTFIGTRVAGIQAVMAASEDVAGGLVDTGLVVVMGVANWATRAAYQAVFAPHRRRLPPADLRFLRGSVAMLVRRQAAGHPRILFAGIRCGGPGLAAQAAALGSLWEDAGERIPRGTRVIPSVLGVAPGSRQVLRRSVSDLLPRAPLGECFALDPFVGLLLDGAGSADRAGRAVACLSEEGTAGALALEHPGLLAQLSR